MLPGTCEAVGKAGCVNPAADPLARHLLYLSCSVAAQGLAAYSALSASMPVRNTPRSTYDKRRRATTRLTLNLIMTLDAQQIRSIRNEFFRFEGATVSLPQFVQIMRTHVPHTQLHTTPLKLVQSLVELFDSMDLDGDRSLVGCTHYHYLLACLCSLALADCYRTHTQDFDEFLATIVHMGMGAADHLVISPVKPYRDGPHLLTTKHHTEQTLQYLPQIDALLCTEYTNNLVKLYDPATLYVAVVSTPSVLLRLLRLSVLTRVGGGVCADACGGGYRSM